MVVTEPTVFVLIPARRASTRLPDKLLLAETGQPLIVHTCRQAAQAFGPDRVVVCADDPALIRAVDAAGFQARMTRLDHRSGTDRIAEVAAGLPGEVFINVQGDEPEIDPGHIRLAASLLARHAWAHIGTLAYAGGPERQADPNTVKVVLAAGDRALWFTRAPAVWNRAQAAALPTCHCHIGLYAYRRAALLGYAGLPASRLEGTEMLEQLRALEAGWGIACAVVDQATRGIDVRSDYDAFLARQRAGGRGALG